MFTVDIFNDPEQCILYLKINFYDMIIIDLSRFKMNGFELYREIQIVDENVKVTEEYESKPPL